MVAIAVRWWRMAWSRSTALFTVNFSLLELSKCHHNARSESPWDAFLPNSRDDPTLMNSDGWKRKKSWSQEVEMADWLRIVRTGPGQARRCRLSPCFHAVRIWVHIMAIEQYYEAHRRKSWCGAVVRKTMGPTITSIPECCHFSASSAIWY